MKYNKHLHLYSVIVASCTFLLLLAGGLVTSTQSGLSVPDWPNTYGENMFLFPPSNMIGGILFEHGHRLIASFVGFLTVILAMWLWKKDERRWMKKLGMYALLAVIAQGVLGGITVLFLLPQSVSTAHATLAQTFFCIVVSIALFTSTEWFTTPKQPADTEQQKSINLTTRTTAVIYLQLILGGMLRHYETLMSMYLLLHVLGAALVFSYVAHTYHHIKRNSQEKKIRGGATMLYGLVWFQFALGIGSFLLRMQMNDELNTDWARVGVTVIHLATGAAMLATSLVLTIRARRNYAAPESSASLNLTPQEANM